MADIKRLRYFEHQFLHANDFTDEQSYEVSMRRRHNRVLHTPGIGDGLDVSFKSGETKVTVQPGTAYDGNGNEIVVLDITDVDLQSLANDATGYLTIRYSEVASDKVNSAGVNDFTRMTETPVFEYDTKAPTNPTMTLLLAVITRQGKQVTKVDPTPRLIAGAKAGDLIANSLSLRVEKFGSSQWPKLSTAPIGQTTNLLTSFSNTSLQLDTGKELILYDNGVIRSNDSAYRLAFNSSNRRVDIQTHTSGDITFLTGATERMRLSANGYLGIGTAIPDQQLTIQSATNAGVVLRGYNNAYGLFLGIENTAGGVLSTITNHDLQLRAGGNTPMLTIKASGNVGIGTTAPGYRLDVADRMRIRQGGSGNSALSFYQTTPAADVATLGMLTDTQFGLYSRSMNQWGLVVDLATNNVGIGVSAPTAKLDVGERLRVRQGPTNPAGIAFYQTTPAADVAYLTMTNDTQIGLFAAKQNRWGWMFDMATGNVGIGILSPASRLDVTGGDIRWGNNSMLKSDQGGSIELGGNETTAGVGSPYIDFHFNGKTQDNNVRIWNDADGRLGLYGTTVFVSNSLGIGGNPQSRFHVVGGDGIIDGSLSVGGAATKGMFDVKGIANIWGDTRSAVSTNYVQPGALVIGNFTKNFGGGSGWNVNTAGLMLECLDNTEIAVHDSGNRVASLAYFEGGSINRLTVGRDMGWGTLTTLAINGNVGIGTPMPQSRLHVAGDGQFDGKITSPMFKVTQVMSARGGPLPITSSSFTTSGGTLLIFMTGSVYTGSAFSWTGVTLYIDYPTYSLGNTYRIVNEASSHKLINNTYVYRPPAGTHTISVYAWSNTLSDAYDYFYITVLELPI